MGSQSDPFIQQLVGINSLFHDFPLLCCTVLFLLGCCVGSFLNVLALRSLKEESVIWPASYCPQCQHHLGPWDNIPVISFLILRGKCRYCAKTISWQYPFVELATGVTFAALAYFFVCQPIPVATFDIDNHSLFQAIHDGLVLSREPNSAQLAQQLSTLDKEPYLFYKYGLFIGCLVFAATLITVTITDFREKLIPHEITYPAMIFGIAFSAFVRRDFLGAMVGIGASYIIFDFLAFYGGKLYMMTHKQDQDESGADLDGQQETDEDQSIDRAFDLQPELGEEEPLEVMGGGDAVLSAVMSAYLGWQLLAVSLIIGFFAGTVMGLGLLGLEMKKAGLLGECGQKSLKWGVFAALGTGGFMASMSAVLSAVMSASNSLAIFLPLMLGIMGGLGIALTLFMQEKKKRAEESKANENEQKSSLEILITSLISAIVLASLALTLSLWMSGQELIIRNTFGIALYTGSMGAAGGALIGMVRVGTRVSKPFPFGPALALGGFIAMFLIPHWLPFY